MTCSTLQPSGPSLLPGCFVQGVTPLRYAGAVTTKKQLITQIVTPGQLLPFFPMLFVLVSAASLVTTSVVISSNNSPAGVK